MFVKTKRRIEVFNVNVNLIIGKNARFEFFLSCGSNW